LCFEIQLIPLVGPTLKVWGDGLGGSPVRAALRANRETTPPAMRRLRAPSPHSLVLPETPHGLCSEDQDAVRAIECRTSGEGERCDEVASMLDQPELLRVRVLSEPREKPDFWVLEVLPQGRRFCGAAFVSVGLQMSAEIVQFVPRPNRNRKSLEQQAAELLEQVDPVALRHQDTAPCEIIPTDTGDCA
jgi:hypothetical protein